MSKKMRMISAALASTLLLSIDCSLFDVFQRRQVLACCCLHGKCIGIILPLQKKGDSIMATDISAFLKYLWMIPVGILVIFILIKLVPRYKIAPPDTALIISGFFRHKYKVRSSDGSVSVKRFGYRIVRGGATFYIPAIERVDKLDMCLMQVDIRTAQPVPTKEYISVLVDNR